MDTSPVIEIRGLKKRYGKVKAVDGLDLIVRKGEFFGFLGPNGAGKTTTIRILTTLSRPDEGEIFIDGKNILKESIEAKKVIGLVPQSINLDSELSLKENLLLHALLFGMERDYRKKRIKEVLHYLGLWDRRNSQVKTLSGGLKRRLMIGRALLHEPKILFMDEPTVGLDPTTRRRLWGLLRKINEEGTTIFLTTHYIEEAENLCHRVGILDYGKIIALDSPENLIARAGKVVVEEQDGDEIKTHFFSNREDASRLLANLTNPAMIRSANLEDVFVGLTGRKVNP